ncbi:MAG: SpoVG family protein, partial [Planctomycetota bacterium]|nr:SpoVG family protein [Planctomycetota bacterium]
MEISEVRVKLVSNSKERLRAFCSITIENEFVIRDLKIIDGLNGTFVAMPSRKLADRCPNCGYKNHLRAHFCNECGQELGEQRGKRATKRGKLHADIAHPINAGCRERIQDIVIGAFEEELEKSKQPDYRPPEFDFGEDSHDDEMRTEHAAPQESTRRQERTPESQRETDRTPAD